jgi:anti-anti-sigma factor
MIVDVSLHGDVARVRVNGRIVDGKPADDLKAALQKIAREGARDTIIDLEEVSWFDSLALGILVAHYASAARRGGRVALVHANEKIRSLMKLARVDDRFGWSADVADALRWLEAGGGPGGGEASTQR